MFMLNVTKNAVPKFIKTFQFDSSLIVKTIVKKVLNKNHAILQLIKRFYYSRKVFFCSN